MDREGEERDEERKGKTSSSLETNPTHMFATVNRKRTKSRFSVVWPMFM